MSKGVRGLRFIIADFFLERLGLNFSYTQCKKNRFYDLIYN